MSQLHTCDHANCGMKFLTQDGLEAHRQVHIKRKSLCLQLPSPSSQPVNQQSNHGQQQLLHQPPQSASLATPQIVDETPTPSGFVASFMRGYEDLTLGRLDEFRPLGSGMPGLTGSNTSDSSNPFAETFKKATAMSPLLPSPGNDPFNRSSEESLNTPCIELRPPDRQRKESPAVERHLSNCDVNSFQQETSAKCNQSSETSETGVFKQPFCLQSAPCATKPSETLVFAPPPTTTCQPSSSTSSSSPAKSQKHRLSRVSLKNSTKTKLEVYKTNSPSTRKPPRILPKNPVLVPPTSSSSSYSSAPTGQTQPEYQLFLKLPSGESVQIPMMQPQTTSAYSGAQYAPTTTMIVQPIVQQTQPLQSQSGDSVFANNHEMTSDSLNGTNGVGTTTLKTLRSALAEGELNQNSPLEAMVPSGFSSDPSMFVQNDINDVANNNTAQFKSKSNGSLIKSDAALSPDGESSNGLNGTTRNTGGRKARHEPKPDPGERKIRSLERNREAAMRCRTRRKVFVGALEDKAETLESTNKTLKSRIEKLTREVGLFKSALLSHKDCPVFTSGHKNDQQPESRPTSNLFDALLAAARRESQNMENQPKT